MLPADKSSSWDWHSKCKVTERLPRTLQSTERSFNCQTDNPSDKSMSGRISILITHYGYPGYLAACVEAALNQSYEDIEIIVIDDASPGDSAESILDRAHLKVDQIIRN